MQKVVTRLKKVNETDVRFVAKRYTRHSRFVLTRKSVGTVLALIPVYVMNVKPQSLCIPYRELRALLSDRARSRPRSDTEGFIVHLESVQNIYVSLRITSSCLSNVLIYFTRAVHFPKTDTHTYIYIYEQLGKQNSGQLTRRHWYVRARARRSMFNE